MAWVLALPMLVGVLGSNLAYHHALRNYLGVAAQNDPMLSPEALLPLQVILVCLQPAIVEEFFFGVSHWEQLLRCSRPRGP